MTQNDFQQAAGISVGLAARGYPRFPIAAFAEFGINKPCAAASLLHRLDMSLAGLPGRWKRSDHTAARAAGYFWQTYYGLPV